MKLLQNNKNCIYFQNLSLSLSLSLNLCVCKSLKTVSLLQPLQLSMSEHISLIYL
ncbi:hypothetical protein OAV88_01065 [bacterium]|nr:hypothetical protein [bacterium]